MNYLRLGSPNSTNAALYSIALDYHRFGLPTARGKRSAIDSPTYTYGGPDDPENSLKDIHLIANAYKAVTLGTDISCALTTVIHWLLR